jgi:hypothetical protein
MSFILDALENEYAKALAYKLYIVNRRIQTPHLVSLAAVYGIAPDADLDVVRAQINSIRSLLINRTFDMARFEKRFPVTGLVADERYCDQDKLLRAFQLCCWCRPSGIIYPPKTQKKKIKACGHYNYCPACWGRVVEQQFHQYTRFLSVCAASDRLSRIYATTHITEQAIPFFSVEAATHTDDETYAQAIAAIGREIARHKQHLNSRRKYTSRKTAASLWRIVPIAAESGWRLQLRQLFLTLPGVEPPIRVPRLARTTFKQTALLTGGMNDDAIAAFIAFSAYPEEHLKEDIDLTSASLNAMARQHMLGGTGKFRTAGDGLIEHARKTAAAQKNATQKSA